MTTSNDATPPAGDEDEDIFAHPDPNGDGASTDEPQGDQLNGAGDAEPAGDGDPLKNPSDEEDEKDLDALVAELAGDEPPKPPEAAKAPAEPPKPPDAEKPPAAAEVPPKAPETTPDADDAAALAEAKTPKQRESMERLIKARNEVRTKVAELEPLVENHKRLVAAINEAGYDNDDDLGVLLETEKLLAKMTPKEVAAYYLDLAKQVDPEAFAAATTPAAPKVVALTQDLRDAVDVGNLTEAEAIEIAGKRELTKNPPPKAETPPPALKPPAPAPQQRTQGPTPQQIGFQGIADAVKPLMAAQGAAWTSIKDAIGPKLKAEMADLQPHAWAKAAVRLANEEIAKRAATAAAAAQQKNQSPSLRPTGSNSQRPAGSANRVTTMEEDAEAIINGHDP